MGSKTSSRHHITKRSTWENYYNISYIQSPPSYEVNNVLKPPALASNWFLESFLFFSHQTRNGASNWNLNVSLAIWDFFNDTLAPINTKTLKLVIGVMVLISSNKIWTIGEGEDREIRTKVPRIQSHNNQHNQSYIAINQELCSR